MKQTVRFGRVRGIPVGMHWSVVVIVALIAQILGASVLPGVIPHRSAGAYWLMAVTGALLFVASLLAHELAHALVARRKGVEVRSITLWLLGGFTELGSEPATPGAELQIALAGPGTSLAAAVAFGAAAAGASAVAGMEVITAALSWLAMMNALLAVFNLLPGAPLDGGRVLTALIWRHYGDRRRAGRAGARAGRYLGVAVAAGGVAEFIGWRNFDGLWLILIGWFLVSAAGAEERAAQIKDVMAGVRVSDIMMPDPDIAPAWTMVADFIQRVAGQSRQTVFPVVGFDGDLAGVVSLDTLSRLPPTARAELRLDRIATAVPPAYRVGPDDPAAALFTRPPLAGELAAVVLAGGRVIGTVTTNDLRRALRLAPLRGPVDNEWPARPRSANG
jgi:Zn-dependent protease/CBS domain-containing protein